MPSTESSPRADIQAVLNTGGHTPLQRRMRWVIAVPGILLLGSITVFWLLRGDESAVRY